MSGLSSYKGFDREHILRRDGKNEAAFIIGDIGSPNFLHRLSQFVRECRRLRQLAKKGAFSGDTDSMVDKTVNQEATRMAKLIMNRVASGGELGVRMQPVRFAPNVSDLILLLIRKWTVQSGLCALCGGKLGEKIDNPLLQPSPDRIDSENASYDDCNVHITHMACNLAKNKYGEDQFREYLDVVRKAEDF